MYMRPVYTMILFLTRGKTRSVYSWRCSVQGYFCEQDAARKQYQPGWQDRGQWRRSSEGGWQQPSRCDEPVGAGAVSPCVYRQQWRRSTGRHTHGVHDSRFRSRFTKPKLVNTARPLTGDFCMVQLCNVSVHRFVYVKISHSCASVHIHQFDENILCTESSSLL